MSKKIVLALGCLVVVFSGLALAFNSFNPRLSEIVEFHPSHTHENGITHGAPQHSGGTDKYGCHNASVPYHCH